MKYTEVSDKVLLALALWELRTLTKNQQELGEELIKLEAKEAKEAEEAKEAQSIVVPETEKENNTLTPDIETTSDPVLSAVSVDKDEDIVVEAVEEETKDLESGDKNTEQAQDKSTDNKTSKSPEVSLPLPEFDITNNNEEFELDYWT